HVQISDNEYHFTVALGLAVFGDGLIDHLPWQRGSRRTDRDLVEEPTRGRGGRHGRKPTCPSPGNASPPTLSDIGLWSLPVGHDIHHSLNYQKKILFRAQVLFSENLSGVRLAGPGQYLLFRPAPAVVSTAPMVGSYVCNHGRFSRWCKLDFADSRF